MPSQRQQGMKAPKPPPPAPANLPQKNPPPPPAQSFDKLQHDKAQRPQDNAIAQELLGGKGARLQGQKGNGKGRGGRGGRGRGDDPPAALEDAAPIAEPAPAAVDVTDGPPPPTPEELEAEALRKAERKAQKKLRRQSTSSALENGDCAVLPIEPSSELLTGVRRCGASSDFLPLCRLGQGAFGRVMLVRWRGDGCACAMKAVRLEEATNSATSLGQLIVERRVLTELAESPHPLLASALCCFRSARHLHFVMPLLLGGTLARLLASQPAGTGLGEESARFYACQIAVALGELHARKMLYLDLKLENVMLNARGHATLVDFGLVRCDVEVLGGQCVKRAGGTRCYLAPEAITSQPVGAPCDWWALGVLLFELLTGQFPFRAENDKAVDVAICNARVRFPKQEREEEEEAPSAAPATAAAAATPAPAAAAPAAAPAPVGPDAVSVVRKLLTKKPEARLGSKGVNEVRGQPFFGSLDWEAVGSCQASPPHVPTLASDVDLRYFDRKHTAHTAPLSAGEPADTTGGADGVLAAKAAAEARVAELRAAEKKLADERAAEAAAAAAAQQARAQKAVDDSRAAAEEAAATAADEASKKVRNMQKKLRQCVELREAAERGEELKKEQKEKVGSIARLEGELAELVTTATQMEEGLAAVKAQNAQAVKGEKKARAAEQARKAKEAKDREADEARRREEQNELVLPKQSVADLSEALAADKFAYVSPAWR